MAYICMYARARAHTHTYIQTRNEVAKVRTPLPRVTTTRGEIRNFRNAENHVNLKKLDAKESASPQVQRIKTRPSLVAISREGWRDGCGCGCGGVGRRLVLSLCSRAGSVRRVKKEKRKKTRNGRKQEEKRGGWFPAEPPFLSHERSDASSSGRDKKPVNEKKKWRTKNHDETRITPDYGTRVIAINWSIPTDED